MKLDKINIMFQSNNAVINLLSLALSKTPWRLKWNRQIYGPDFFQLSLKTFIEIELIQVKTTGYTYTDDSSLSLSLSPSLSGHPVLETRKRD